MTDRKTPDGLDAFFDAARDATPDPSATFLARLEADALAAMPVPVPLRPTQKGPGLWAQILQAIGGAPGMAGLATACAVGLWVGVAQPTGLTNFLNTQSVGLDQFDIDPLTAFDFAMMEG